MIFYIALAALFAICMKGLLSTINNDNPKWQLDESIIGEEPGLTFRPFYPDDPHELIPLIKFATDSQEDITKWTSNLDEFLDGTDLGLIYLKKLLTILIFAFTDYKKTNSNRKSCNYGGGNHTVCMMDIKTLGDCTGDNAYGYNNSKPCVFLKLNKIYGWVPNCYNDSNNLPEEMPKDLVEHINSLEPSKRNQVWVSCNAARNGTADTPLEYNPRGFPSYFFPYLNHKGYVSPIVAVKLANPEINKQFEVECRYWAKGIEYRDSNKDRRVSWNK